MTRWLKYFALAIGTVLLLAVVLFAIGVLWPVQRLEPVRTTTPLAITDVAVVDVERGVLVPDQTVVVREGRIAAVGDATSVAIPAGATEVSGAGRFLIPGLWDMHAHVLAISPLLDLPLYVAFGVTNLRDMQGCPKRGDPFIACADDKRRWTEEAIRGQRVAPRVVASTSFMANGPVVLERIPDLPPYFATATAAQARRFVRRFAGEVDEIKVYDRLPRDAYFALVEEAHRLRLPVVGHRPRGVSAIEAAEHQKSLEHARFILHESFAGSAELRAQAGTGAWREDRRRMLDEHDPAMAAEIFAAMRRHGTWYVPTHLTRWVDAYADDATVRQDPLLRYLHPLLRWQWLEDVDATLARDPSAQARQTYRDFYRKGLELTGAAHRAGVRVLAGSDYVVAGADLHRELEQLVLAGLSPAQAVRAATLSPAEYFDLTSDYGTVEAGKVADLVLLTANPLDAIGNTRQIEAVIFAGNLYDRDALDRIDRHVRRQARSWTVACKILWRFIKSPASY